MRTWLDNLGTRGYAIGAGVLALALALLGGYFALDDPWSGLCLELGASVLLVLPLFLLEMSFEARLREGESRIREEVTAQEESIDDLSRQVEELRSSRPGAFAVERALDKIQDQDNQLVLAFRDHPTPERLRALASRSNSLKASHTHQIQLTEICSATIGPSKGDTGMEIKIFQSKSGGGIPAYPPVTPIRWDGEEDLESMVTLFIDRWQRSGMYPGREAAESLDLAGAIADKYEAAIRSVTDPQSVDDDRASGGSSAES
ncbi:MAG: hypothetical protein AAF962_18195 [Actinomycetota bacterium]